MAVSAIPPIVPLSSFWTPQLLIGEVRVIINELDNERIQNMNIRTHLNLAIGHLAQLLNIAQEPWYQITWKIATEAALHFTGVPWVNLATQVTPLGATSTAGERTPQPAGGLITPGDVIPANLISEIRTVLASKTSGQPTNTWRGNLTKLSDKEIFNLSNQYNTQYRQSMCWHHSGSAIYLHQGSQIAASGTEFVTPGQLSLIGTRYPLLDNLLGEDTTGSGFLQLVDFPDKHMRLAVLLAQKMCLEQLSKAIPPSLDSEVAQLSQQITGNVINELQFEQGKRSKVDQGFQTR